MMGPLLTDLYQLTMAYGYWKHDLGEREACFHQFFRRHPFGGAYAVACGLSAAVEFLEGFRFSDDDLAYLAGLELFDPAFLDHLGALRFECDVDAAPEGAVVFAHEPVVRVQGPLLQAQLVETALLNLVNFQTLIATKAARVCYAAQADLVIEFGLRRAHGPDGGMAASRAAYVGGCAATSNVLAAKRYGIPVRGTHAHSWVMSFQSEEEAFRAYAEAMPGHTVLLVDTYDTVEGIRKAIAIGERHGLVGIRLDSGNLLKLSRTARTMLDEAGLTETQIVASGDLDEYRIASLKASGAPIDQWGVGTRLATAHDDPSLGGVYKLAAIHEPSGGWDFRLKLSDDPGKATNPGILQVRRYGTFERDLIFDIGIGAPDGGADLLVPVFRRGERVYDVPTAAAAREYAATQVRGLPEPVRRLKDPVPYRVELEPGLAELKRKLAQS